uniref:Uncharacterized protein n=2 Tax=Sus scrofa TaxID=9823 RepID=A0A8D1U080_PIG
MLLLLHEQDKMAPDWFHPEVNSNNIRLPFEAILSPRLGKVAEMSSFRPAALFCQPQDGLLKGLKQFFQ